MIGTVSQSVEFGITRHPKPYTRLLLNPPGSVHHNPEPQHTVLRCGFSVQSTWCVL